MKQLVIFVLILIPIISKSTCIIIFKTKEKIYVASDSRRNLIGIMDGKEILLQSQTICKIHKIQNVYFAISGHDDSTLEDNAKQCLLKFKNINESIKWFCEKIKNHYSSLLKFEKNNNIEGFNYYLKNSIAAVSFFGFNNNIPYLITIEFHMKYIDGVKIYYDINEQLTIAQLGFHDHYDKISEIDFKKKMSDNRGIIYGLESLIKLEIDHHPKDVNYPIDLLELTQNGSNWIRKKKNCN